MGRPSHRQFLTSFHGADTTYIRILFFTDYSYLHLILCIKPLQKNTKHKEKIKCIRFVFTYIAEEKQFSLHEERF